MTRVLLPAAAVLLLAGCVTYPAMDGTVDGEIVHKEHIPASTHIEEYCSGAVPMMCHEEVVKDRQCWRFDVHTVVAIEGDRRDYGVVPVCVFPSEFDAYEVGDTYTNKGKVRY